jgi:hypothetical protein
MQNSEILHHEQSRPEVAPASGPALPHNAVGTPTARPTGEGGG